jgi:chemosensory pili system protein ChpA (sensor histidine kinase/response regulator)
MSGTAELDIGPLTWVKGEIDLALERAGEALTRYGAATADAAPLKQARSHLHQAHGALSIVGLDGVTQFSDTLEKLLAALEDGSVAWSAAVDAAAQQGLAAIRHYLDDLVGGLPDQPLRLQAAYRAMIIARGQPEPPASDLFFPDLTQRPPKREREPAPLTPEALATRLKAARLGYERGLLKWIKNEPKGITEMRNSVAVIEATQTSPAARAFWWAALAFLDAAAAGALPADPLVKRLGARIDAQIKKLLEGSGTVSERLMRDTLYCVAIAGPAGDHVECVRAAYRLAELVPAAAAAADVEARRPLLRAIREHLAAAMEEWSRFCAGTAAALPAFHERIDRIDAQARDLDQADFARLAAALAAYANQVRKDPLRHGEASALEVATALLLAESALENFAALGAEFAHQTDVICARLDALARGETVPQGEIPHLDEMSRRAQERRLMSTVAKEILVNLGVVEQTLDAFFRDPTRTAELAGLTRHIGQIEGALAVLGQERALAVLHEAALGIRKFTQEGYTPDQADFEAVASKLSALGFFVEKLQSGAADIDAILNPVAAPAPAAEPEEAATASVEAGLDATRRMTQTLVRALRDKPEDEALRGEMRQTLETLRDDARLVADAALEEKADAAIAALDEGAAPIAAAVADIAPAAPAVVEPSADALRLAEAGSAAIDAELLAIFLEEAHEVLDTIAATYPQAQAAPGDREALNVMRRSFHTLKGSGRMVGLNELGEAAWAVEQVMNGWLQQEKEATPGLLDMIGMAFALFRDWVAQLEAGGSAARDAAALVAACERLKGGAEAIAEAAPPPAGDDAVDIPATPEPEAPPANTAEQAEAAAPKAPVLQLVHSAPPEPEPIRIGELALSPTLYGIYLDEARGHVATLQAELGRDGVPRQELIRAAHTLASISATTGIESVHGLAHALEVALVRFAAAAAEPQDGQRMLLARIAGALEGMVGAVAERRLPAPEETLTTELAALEPLPAPVAAPTPAPAAEPAGAASPAAAPVFVAAPPPAGLPQIPAKTEANESERRQVRIKDDIDPQLLPLFLDESEELLPAVGDSLREWRAAPAAAADIAERLKRELHTLKGSARMAGAMAVGELVHHMETRVEQAGAMPTATPVFLDELDASFDRVAMLVEGLRSYGAEPEADVAAEPAAAPAAALATEATPRAQLRVRADLVDRLVNEAGEMAIARSRIEGEMRTLKSSLLDLTENVIRLRSQLREIEIQAESQMQSRQADTASAREFDPLEFDRFTRFQELTRMMAESVNDVSTVQHNLLKNLDHANAALAAQSRLNRELSQSLMGVRMVPFVTIADRLHRVVRQTAKELDRRANLDIRGGQTEIDRSVLERMTAPLEHLLRNAVAHGIEDRAARLAAGKPEFGEVAITLTQEGNEIVVIVADDGRGFDLARIRAIAAERGLLVGADLDDEKALTQLIFSSGFSTADQLSEVAGRGVGMDVVKNEAAGLGGRVEAHSATGRGATFRIYLPLTLAVTQAVLVRAGSHVYAIPSTMVEQASEMKPVAIEQVRAEGSSEWLGNRYPWHYLPRLFGDGAAQPQPARRHWLLLLKGGAQRIALEVDAMLGNQEIVVKSIGPQLARIPGIAGATVLGDGEIVLILNPVALAARSGAVAVAPVAAEIAAPATPAVPTVLVVDDSLTVRKITGRLLAREGYHVLTAKDGVDALEQMSDLLPDVVLADIEMPRMDGFELVRGMRADARLKDVPVVMITSRIADRHRNYAQEIGVDHYLGKPYDEDELLRIIAGYVGAGEDAEGR